MTRLLNSMGTVFLVASGIGAVIGMIRDALNGESKWFVLGLCCLALAQAIKFFRKEKS